MDRSSTLLSRQGLITKTVTLISYCWLLPVIYYFYTYGRFTVNTPFGDDITLIIGRTVNYIEAKDFWSGLDYVFSQSEEYRVPFIVLSGILSAKLLGYINFSLIGFFGNASLFAAFLITVYLLAKTAREFRVIAIIAFFLLASPVYAGCMFWTNCTVGHFGSIFCGALACLFLSRSGLFNFLCFELALVTAIFTHGNGIGLLPMGFMGLWYCQKTSHDKFLFLGLHGAICVVILVAGFVTFDDNSAELISTYTAASITQSPLHAAMLTLTWLFSWMGTWASFSNNLTTAFWVGIIEAVMITALFVSHRKTLLNEYGQLTLLIIFLILTIAGASLLRAHYWLGIDHVFTDRFRVYSLALLICLVCLFLALVRDGKVGNFIKAKDWNVVAMLLIVVSGIYFLKVNYDRQPVLVAHKNQQLKCAMEWEKDGVSKPCTWHGDNKIIMDRAVAIGILNINRNGTEPLRCQEPYLKYCWK